MNTIAARQNELEFLEVKGKIRRQSWLYIAGMYLILSFFAWIFSLLSGDLTWWLHGLWCLIAMIPAAIVARWTVRNGISSVLVDHKIILTAAFTLYFVFGASFLAFGPELDVERALNYYPIVAIDALKVNAFNSLGMAITLFTGALFKGEWVIGGARRAAKYVKKIPLELVIFIMFAISLIGVSLTFVRDLLLAEIIVPGMFNHLSYLLLFTIFIGAAYKGKRQFALIMLSVVAAIFMMLKGILLFSKTDLYLPVISLAVGISLRRHTIKPLIIASVIVFFTMSSAGNIVSYGRENTGKDGMTVKERIAIINNYYSVGFNLRPEQYSTWSRLCYTAPQAAAIEFYDQGNGGDAINIIHWIFVPRLLFESKPVMSDAGSDFHYKITGYRTSSTGIGVFVSGYYQLGIIGFLFASIFSGWFLSQTSAMCRYMLEQKAYLLLPLGMIGLYVAFRIDGEILSDYVGFYVFFLYPLIALLLLFGVQSKRGVER